MIGNRAFLRRVPGCGLLGAVLAALICSVLPLAGQADSTPPATRPPASPAQGYTPHARLVQTLNSLSQANSGLVAVAEIVRSPGGRAIHAVRVAAGQGVENRAALLVVANAWGPHLIGTEIAVGAIRHMAESYGRDSAVTRLLDTHAVYVIPRANPDAAEALFGGNIWERIRNDATVDDDRDQAEDEDGPDDLNGDGMITAMRIRDPAGEWLSDPADPDFVRRADRVAGERGVFRVELEGTDDDGDGLWSEDPLGGVNVNANFSYDYEFFGQATGIHQMSSPEARAIAQFFVDQSNIAAVYVLGPQDNLMTPWHHTPGTGIGSNPQGTSQGGPLQSILSGDEDFFAEVGERFKATTGFEGTAPSAPSGGDLLSFSYYHMGRWAFGSRGWWIPAEPDANDPAAGDRQRFQWVKQNIPDGFVPWTALQHPDFPGRSVEVGGLRPYVTINPPADLIDSVVTAHANFIVELGNMLPVVAFGQAQVESLGDRVYRVTTRVHNNGYLPTVSGLGVQVRWPRRIRLEVRLGGGQTIVSGPAVELIGPISGSGAAVERTWVIVGPPGSNVTLTASSPVAGTTTQQISLR